MNFCNVSIVCYLVVKGLEFDEEIENELCYIFDNMRYIAHFKPTY